MSPKYTVGSRSTADLVRIADALEKDVQAARAAGSEQISVSVYDLDAVLDLLRQVTNTRNIALRRLAGEIA